MNLKRVYAKHGAWYYVDLTNKWHRLCRQSEGETALLKAYAAFMESGNTAAMKWLAAEWAKTKLGKYAPDVRKEYARMAGVIGKAFAEFGIEQVRTVDVAEFLSTNFADKPNAAKKYSNVLSKMFRMSITKGLREINPCDALDLSDYATSSSGILIPHAAIKAIREAALIGEDGRPTLSGEMFCCIVDMTYLLFQRAKDIRLLTDFQIGPTHIRFQPSKTAKKTKRSVELLITPAIARVIERARAIKAERKICSTFLFPTTSGTAYTRSGLYSMWRRARARAGITEPYEFRQLRPLSATDAEQQGAKVSEIRKRLVHSSEGMTEAYLRERAPEESAIELELPW